MKVFFTDAARNESLEAFEYYQERSEKAASHFLLCLETATSWLSRHPGTGKPLSLRTRRYLMRTFLYLVICRIFEESIWIVGVVHEKRDPKSWRDLL